MTTLVATCWGFNPGDFAFKTFLTVWKDNTLVAKHEIPNNSFVCVDVSSDGRFACCSSSNNASSSYILDIENNTLKEVVGLASVNVMEYFGNAVLWTRRGYFVSQDASRAYDPYKDQLISLPNMPAIPEHTGTYNFLLQEGIFLELPDHINDPNIVGKDLFTGTTIPLSDKIVANDLTDLDLGYAITWHDTYTRGMLHNRGQHNLPLIINTQLGWSMDVRSLTSDYNVDVLFSTSRGVLFVPYDWNDFGFLIKPDGTREVVPYPGHYNEGVKRCFNIYYEDARAWYYEKDYPYEGQIATFSQYASPFPAEPPAFLTDMSLWLPHIQVSSLLSVSSPVRFYDSIAQDGQFWTNRKFASEAIL